MRWCDSLTFRAFSDTFVQSDLISTFVKKEKHGIPVDGIKNIETTVKPSSEDRNWYLSMILSVHKCCDWSAAIWTFTLKTAAMLFQLAGGVPQGSILGPLILSQYINDRPSVRPEVWIQLYADDCVWFIRGRTKADDYGRLKLPNLKK